MAQHLEERFFETDSGTRWLLARSFCAVTATAMIAFTSKRLRS